MGRVGRRKEMLGGVGQQQSQRGEYWKGDDKGVLVYAVCKQ